MRLTASRCARCGTPSCECFLGEPYCEAAPLAQGCVVRRPIRQPVPLLGDMVTASGIGLERHGRCPRSGRKCFFYGTGLQAPNGSCLQHVRTPLVTQEESSGVVERVGECCHVYGLICGHSHAAGPDEVRGSGPIQSGALEARCCTLVFLIPSHRPLRHPSPSTFLRPNSPTDASAYTLAAGAR
jgi:hypothetical protein